MSETPITDILRTVIPILMFGAGLWAGIKIERAKKKPLPSPPATTPSDGASSGKDSGNE